MSTPTNYVGANALAAGLEELADRLRRRPELAPVLADEQVVHRCTTTAEWFAMAMALRGGRLETLEWGAAAQVSRRFGGIEVVVIGYGIPDSVLDVVEAAFAGAGDASGHREGPVTGQGAVGAPAGQGNTSPAPVSSAGEAT